MERQTANLLVEDWRFEGPVDSEPSSDASRRLTQLMLELVGEPDAVAGATLEDGSRAALVLHGSSLFIASAEGEAEDTNVKVRREPLDPFLVTVSMNERKVGDPPIQWERTWTFKRDGEPPFLSFRTRSPRRDDPEPRAAAFARALCRAIGWPVPPDPPA